MRSKKIFGLLRSPLSSSCPTEPSVLDMPLPPLPNHYYLAASFPVIIPESMGSSHLKLPGMSYIHPEILNILGTIGKIRAIPKLKGHPNK